MTVVLRDEGITSVTTVAGNARPTRQFVPLTTYTPVPSFKGTAVPITHAPSYVTESTVWRCKCEIRQDSLSISQRALKFSSFDSEVAINNPRTVQAQYCECSTQVQPTWTLPCRGNLKSSHCKCGNIKLGFRSWLIGECLPFTRLRHLKQISSRNR